MCHLQWLSVFLLIWLTKHMLVRNDITSASWFDVRTLHPFISQPDLSLWFFLPCRSALFYLWVKEVIVELRFLLTPSFPLCNPWPSVARFLVSGRCEAHLRQSWHALWLHLSPNMSAWWAAVSQYKRELWF